MTRGNNKQTFQFPAEKVAILVLARTELIFLTVACMMMCFRFVVKTVLITQG